jgi:hypothetical protein
MQFAIFGENGKRRSSLSRHNSQKNPFPRHPLISKYLYFKPNYFENIINEFPIEKKTKIFDTF